MSPKITPSAASARDGDEAFCGPACMERDDSSPAFADGGSGVTSALGGGQNRVRAPDLDPGTSHRRPWRSHRASGRTSRRPARPRPARQANRLPPPRMTAPRASAGRHRCDRSSMRCRPDRPAGPLTGDRRSQTLAAGVGSFVAPRSLAADRSTVRRRRQRRDRRPERERSAPAHVAFVARQEASLEADRHREGVAGRSLLPPRLPSGPCAARHRPAGGLGQTRAAQRRGRAPLAWRHRLNSRCRSGAATARRYRH